MLCYFGVRAFGHRVVCTDCSADVERRRQCQEQLMRQMCQNETLCRHILHVTILHSTTVVPFSSLWQRELKCFFLLLLFTFSLSSVNWERDPCTFDTHTHTHTQTFIKSLGCMLFASRKYGCDHAGIAKSCTHLRGCPLDSYQCVLHSQCYNKNCCHV